MAAGRRRLRGDEAELFQNHHERLKRSVARAVAAPDTLIEDACSFAWVQLVGHQPDRTPRLFAWLRAVAIHEAYRLTRIEGREASLEDLAAGVGEGWEAVFGHTIELDRAIEARHALDALAGLPERERRYLALFVAGFGYDEIARHAGDRSLNHVNKHLVRARARLRRAGRQT